jgi:hypothetical protein
MTIAAKGKQAKTEVNYRKGSVRQRCSLCVHFKPKVRACTEVRGLIEPGYLCDLFERKKA